MSHVAWRPLYIVPMLHVVLVRLCLAWRTVYAVRCTSDVACRIVHSSAQLHCAHSRNSTRARLPHQHCHAHVHTQRVATVATRYEPQHRLRVGGVEQWREHHVIVGEALVAVGEDAPQQLAALLPWNRIDKLHEPHLPPAPKSSVSAKVAAQRHMFIRHAACSCTQVTPYCRHKSIAYILAEHEFAGSG